MTLKQQSWSLNLGLCASKPFAFNPHDMPSFSTGSGMGAAPAPSSLSGLREPRCWPPAKGIGDDVSLQDCCLLSKCAGREPGWKLSAHGKKENRSQQKEGGKGSEGGGREEEGRKARGRGGGECGVWGSTAGAGAGCRKEIKHGLLCIPPKWLLLVWSERPGTQGPGHRTDPTGGPPPCLSTTDQCVSDSRSVMSDSATPWTASHQAPLSMEFSRQEYWSGLPCPSGDLSNPGIKPRSPALQVISVLSHQGSPTIGEARLS